MAGAWIFQTELASHDCGTWVKRGAKSSNDPTLYPRGSPKVAKRLLVFELERPQLMWLPDRYVV